MSFLLFLYSWCSPFTHFSFFFFNDTATTEIYTLSLHDALPICPDDRRRDVRVLQHPGHGQLRHREAQIVRDRPQVLHPGQDVLDRKSTRLNSSHANISYAVFCLKKKKKKKKKARVTLTSNVTNI